MASQAMSKKFKKKKKGKTKEMKGGLVRRSGLVFADDERAESACGRVGSQRAECV